MDLRIFFMFEVLRYRESQPIERKTVLIIQGNECSRAFPPGTKGAARRDLSGATIEAALRSLKATKKKTQENIKVDKKNFY